MDENKETQTTETHSDFEERMESFNDKMLDLTVKLLDKKKFIQIRQLLEELNPVDIAALFEELPENDIPLVFRILPKDVASETFSNMDSEMQEQLIRVFNDKELKELIDEMFLDDTVDMVEEMPANIVKRILKNADNDTRQMINTILNYPDDSAGSLMTIEYIDLKKDMTVNEAFDHIRKFGIDKETIYTCYVTTYSRKLLGIVTVKDLLLSPGNAVLGDIMDTNVIYVDTAEDKEIVANTFAKYDLMALPVVDKECRLVGIVTVDDAVDVLTEEATEDIEKMAAITPTDKPYLKTSVFETWKKRIPWLLILMVSATFTGSIISGMEGKMGSIVGAAALTAFIPMLMDTGGNSGGQSSVTIIRGLSLGEIEPGNILTIIWKELRVGIFCGATLGIVNFAKILIVDKLFNPAITIPIAGAVCFTLFTTVILAKLVGCTLPILAKKIGFDPAVMASPFITTIVDALSLLIYFGISALILGA